MAELYDRHMPGFAPFPVNSECTYYGDVHIPCVLAVPHAYTMSSGVKQMVSDALPVSVALYIEEAPGKTPVSGYIYSGVFVPTYERYVKNIELYELWPVNITPSSIDDDTDFSVALRDSTTDSVRYYADALYFDMSGFTLPTGNDLPKGAYYLVYKVGFRNRIVNDEGELQCLSEDIVYSYLKFLIKHPGEIIDSAIAHMPEFYVKSRSFDDPTITFLQPFTEILQTVYNEQTLLTRINDVDYVPAALMPYLAFLVGWDLPNYPGVTDEVKRALIRNAYRLQQLKGTKRCLRELFELFGFTIDMINLWWSTDGKVLIGPNDEVSGYESQQITTTPLSHTDLLISELSSSTYDSVTVPLIHKPYDDLTIIAFAVSKTSATYNRIKLLADRLSANVDVLDNETIAVDQNGFLTDIDYKTLSVNTDSSRCLIDYDTGAVEIVEYTGAGVLSEFVRFDRYKTNVQVAFNRYLDLNEDKQLFVFITYRYNRLNIPQALTMLRSNRFDLGVLYKNGEVPEPQLYDFLIKYVFELKSFHSLLRKLKFQYNVNEIYNVTDTCVNTGRPCDIAYQQIPPAVIPHEVECSYDSWKHGLKEIDIEFQSLVKNGLKEQFEAWSHMGDHGHSQSGCGYPEKGQNRTLDGTDETLCKLDGRPYIYNGRVVDDCEAESLIPLLEEWRFKRCSFGLGKGVYWISPFKELSQADAQAKADKNKSWHHWRMNVDNYIANEYRHLRYSERDGFSDPKKIYDMSSLVYNKPSLNIDRWNVSMPGYRLPSINKLENDYVNLDYRMTPWDWPFDPSCTPSPIDLHPRLVVGSDGDEYLIYDDYDMIYYGNGYSPDIPTLGCYTASYHTDAVVTHKVYSSGRTSIYVEEDNVDYTTDTYLEVPTEFVGLFRSQRKIGGVTYDYIDGYPSKLGPFDYSFSLNSSSLADQLYDELGEPSISYGSECLHLFTLSSGILTAPDEVDHLPAVRLDCGCLSFELDGSGSVGSQPEDGIRITSCITDDEFPDVLDISQAIILKEPFGVKSEALGLSEHWPFLLPLAESFNELPNKGSGFLKDDWGTIYKFAYEKSGNVIDITTWISTPWVWGQPHTGYIKDGRVYRRGIITAIRQIIEVNDRGYVVTAEGQSQYIGDIQTTFKCADDRPSNPFIWDMDNSISDEVVLKVTYGPHWTDPAGEVQSNKWPGIIETSSGIEFVFSSEEYFYFIDVWGN